jgi:hypothetical protein
MAVKYWENLLKNLELDINRTEYNQMEVTRAVLDKRWTRAAIESAITKANNARAKKGLPELTPSKNIITRAVNEFHKTVAGNRGKSTSMEGVDTKVAGSFIYPKRKRVSGGGRKVSYPGRVFSASETEIVADNFGEINKVMAAARKAATDILENNLSAPGELKGLDNIHFAHGEGTSKTTLGALSGGKEALTVANSRSGEDALKKQFKKDGVKLDNLNLIKKAGVKGLRDYMTEELRIRIGINERERGSKAEFNDTFVVEGAMKMQDKAFARKYDAASKKGETLKGIQKTYFEAVQKALRKRWAQGDIQRGEYQSSPSGKKRAKNIVKRVCEKNFKKALAKHPEFKVTNSSKKLTKVNKKTKTVKKNTKTSEKIKAGTKATIAGRKSNRQSTTNPGANPLALKELINAALPEEILERMNPPALRNRTGRFRRSAQVTNVLVGPRGGVEAEYTYMKMPYQTFEPGYAQGSTYRDPRKIIGESVREIAQKLTGNRFIKVRRI